MILALLILVVCVLALRLVAAPKRQANRRTVVSERDREVEGIITVDEFEGEVGDALERGSTPQQYAERWEIHVHDAPPGHSLHIHLP